MEYFTLLGILTAVIAALAVARYRQRRDLGLVVGSRGRSTALSVDAGLYAGFIILVELTQITERCFHDLMASVARVTLPDAPAPADRSEELAYYPGAEQIAAAARALLARNAKRAAA